MSLRWDVTNMKTDCELSWLEYKAAMVAGNIWNFADDMRGFYTVFGVTKGAKHQSNTSRANTAVVLGCINQINHLTWFTSQKNVFTWACREFTAPRKANSINFTITLNNVLWEAVNCDRSDAIRHPGILKPWLNTFSSPLPNHLPTATKIIFSPHNEKHKSNSD